MTTPWPRIIALVDMDAFFASIEQRDNPKWRGRPVAVTNGRHGSCIITCSYEARAFAIKTGMRMYEAKRLCPDLIHAPSRPYRYAETSREIMRALRDITPDIEVFSVDEAFLDLTRCQKIYASVYTAAELIKQTIFEVSGLSCSVGVSRDKTSAKYAAKLQKPDGLCVIEPDVVAAWLARVPVTDLCGIARGIGGFLAQHGVITCGDMAKLPVSVLGKRFGPLGKRIWLMCQGLDNSAVQTQPAMAKTLGHGKVLPPGTISGYVVLPIWLHLCDKLAVRMRKHDLTASQFWIALRDETHGWIGEVKTLPQAMADGKKIFECVRSVWKVYGGAGVVTQIQVTALNPRRFVQQDWMSVADDSVERRQDELNRMYDEINHRFGMGSIGPARLVSEENPTAVISPAWRDEGERSSV